MTTEHQRTANRANASKSTGPKTRRGKQIVSRNAYKHGLTTPPAPATVQRWGRIILGEPEATDADLYVQGPELRALAEAEARLERAWDAERDCVAELVHEVKLQGERDPTLLSLDDIEHPTVLEFLLSSPKNDLDKEALKVLLSMWHPTIPPLLKRLRTIQRYVTQAKRAQARAFTDWITARRRAA
jgi:hypothetical protein